MQSEPPEIHDTTPDSLPYKGAETPLDGQENPEKPGDPDPIFPVISAGTPAKEEEEAKARCPNCDKKLPKKADYCPRCGQKQADSKVTMRLVLKRLWNTTFHLDNKFWRMVWHLLMPGRVTKAYFQGKVQRYPHPIQFFFVCMFFFLFFMHRLADTSKMRFNTIEVFTSGESAEMMKGKLILIDSLEAFMDLLPESMKTPNRRVTADSLLAYARHLVNDVYQDSIKRGDFTVFGKENPVPIAYRDIILLEPDSLVRYYEVRPHWYAVLLRQMIKATKDGQGVGAFWVGMASWVSLAQIAMMSVWFWLLYLKQKRYFVEHFVFLLHIHSGFLFLSTITLIINHLQPWLDMPIALPYLWLWLGLGYGMYRYYGQKKRWTILKWLVLTIIYLINLLLVTIGSLAASVLLY